VAIAVRMVSGAAQKLRHAYHIDLPTIRPIVPRVELFGLTISEGAIANIFRRTGDAMAAAAKAITDKLLTAKVIASDKTTTRTNGVTRWQWVFISDQAVLHKIAPRRARNVPFRKVTNGFRSDRDAQIHAGYRSVTGTARLQGQPAFAAMRDLIDGNFAIGRLSEKPTT